MHNRFSVVSHVLPLKKDCVQHVLYSECRYHYTVMQQLAMHELDDCWAIAPVTAQLNS